MIKKTLRFLWPLLLLAACCPCRVKAGGWTLPKGGWYVEESFAFFETVQDYGPTGEKKSKVFGGVYNQVLAKTYVEYGLKDRWNILVALPYRAARFVDDYSDIHTAGFKDVTGGVKWRWTEDPAVVSFALNASVPTGYDRNEPLALDKGRGNMEARVFVSRQFKVGAGRLFADIEFAKDRYGTPYYAEVIHLPLPWLFTKFYVVGMNNYPRQPDGEDFLKWNLGVGLASQGSNAVMRSERYKSISYTLFYGETLRGRNSGHGSDVTLAVALVF